jgi:transcriptional regulator with XRE-family HTH domain
MSDRDAAPFGVFLRQFRLATRLTQEELAASASRSSEAVAALARGKRRTPVTPPSSCWLTRWGLSHRNAGNLRRRERVG